MRPQSGRRLRAVDIPVQAGKRAVVMQVLVRAVGQGAIALVLGAVVAGCNSGALPGNAPKMQALEPVADDLAAKAQGSCWFKVKSRSSRSEERRLWDATKAVGASTERLGQLLIVTGALEIPVHEARFYGCSLFEYTAGSPVVMTATVSPVPVRADTLIPYGFSKDGKKELK